MKSEDAQTGELTNIALVEALKKLEKAVSGVTVDIRQLRGDFRTLFEHMLQQEVRQERQGEEQVAQEARLTLLERRVSVLERGAEAPNTNGSGAASGPTE